MLLWSWEAKPSPHAPADLSFTIMKRFSFFFLMHASSGILSESGCGGDQEDVSCSPYPGRVDQDTHRPTGPVGAPMCPHSEPGSILLPLKTPYLPPNWRKRF